MGCGCFILGFSRFVSGCRFVGGFIRGSRAVILGCGFVLMFLRVLSFTLITHISNVTIRTRLVTNNLDTAIREVDPVFPSGIIVFPVFIMAEHGSIVGVIYTILVVVHGGNCGVFGFAVRRFVVRRGWVTILRGRVFILGGRVRVGFVGDREGQQS